MWRTRASIAQVLALLMRPWNARLLAQGVTSASNLITALAVTKLLGPAAFGIYSFFLLIALFGVSLCQSVFIEPATRVSATIATQDLTRYLSSLGLTFALVVLAAALPLLWLLGALADLFLAHTSRSLELAALAFIIAYIASESTRFAFQAFASSKLIFSFNFVRVALSLSLLALALLDPDRFDSMTPATLIIASQAIAFCMGTLCFGVVLARKAAIPSYALWDNHRRMVGATTSLAVVRYLQVNSPAFWAQAMLGEEILGIARASQSVANVITLPINAFRLRLMKVSAADHEKLGVAAFKRRVLGAAARLTLLAIGLGLLVALAVAFLPDFVNLPESTGYYAGLYIAFNIALTANSALSVYFYSTGRLQPLLLRVVFLLALALALAPLLLHAIGGPGLPLTQLLVALMGTAFNLRFILREAAR